MAFLARVSPKHIGWEPYIYLVFLGFMFFQPFYDPSFGLLNWVLTGVLIAVFLPVHLLNFVYGGRRAFVGICTIALLGVVGMFVNTGSSSFFIYAAAGAPYVVRNSRQAALLIAAIVGGIAVSFFISPVPLPERLWAFSPALIFVPINGVINIFQAEKDRGNRALRRANKEIERLAKVAERERIARDLHDLLGHTLSMITLKSELAARLARTDPGRAEREMSEVARVSRDALKEVREAVRGYRARDLTGELTRAREMLAAAGVRLEYFTEPLTLPPVHESALALALREAATNVVRHARASVCTVRLLRVEGEARLEVDDDGLGKCAPDGAGLAGMGERAALLGGRLSVQGSSAGTRLCLTLPLGDTVTEMAEDAVKAKKGVATVPEVRESPVT